MTERQIGQFFNLLHIIVNDDAPYIIKKEKILEQAGDADKTNLEEFASWGWETE